MDRKSTSTTDKVLDKLGAKVPSTLETQIADTNKEIQKLKEQSTKVENYQKKLKECETLRSKTRKNLIFLALSLIPLGAIVASGIAALALGASIGTIVVAPILLVAMLAHFVSPVLGIAALIAETAILGTALFAPVTSILSGILSRKELKAAEKELKELEEGIEDKYKKHDGLTLINEEIARLEGELTGLEARKNRAKDSKITELEEKLMRLEASKKRADGTISRDITSKCLGFEEGTGKLKSISFNNGGIGKLDIDIFCKKLNETLDSFALLPGKKQEVKLDLSNCDISSPETVYKILDVLAKKGISISEVNLMGNSLLKGGDITDISQSEAFKSVTEEKSVVVTINGGVITVSHDAVPAVTLEESSVAPLVPPQ